MDLFLIRHGESTNNALSDQNQRVYDPDLTDLGHVQARALASHLAAGGHQQPAEPCVPSVHRLYCSAMLRTLQTTRPVAEALSIQPEIWVDLHEVGGLFLDKPDGTVEAFGGTTREQLAERFPGYNVPPAISDDGWWGAERGKESPAAARGRAIAVTDKLRRFAADLPDGERVAIVTHGDFMNSVVLALLDRLPSWGLYYEHLNTAITRIHLSGDGSIRIRYLNRAGHLGDLTVLPSSA
ncbi:MAG: histidine phosphatase family protein [Candidatus Latescibacterota bacterium]|nr:histidine phosphatase family protein [Candidatus Latescibacterota bacterium]